MSYAKILPTLSDVIYMRHMKPCQIGVIVTEGNHKNEIVMRTAMTTWHPYWCDFEVMSLSELKENSCWSIKRGRDGSENVNNLKVRLLPPGTQITLTVF